MDRRKGHRELVREDEPIPYTILHYFRELIVRNKLLIHKGRIRELRRLVHERELIPLSVTATLLEYFKAATPELLRGILGLSKSTIHKYLKALVALGFAVRVEKAYKGRGRRGPKSVIYASPGFTEEDIRRAHMLEMMRTTKFLDSVLQGRDLAIHLLKRRGSRELSMSGDLIPLIREKGLASSFSTYDVANEVARLLELEGVRIWR